MSDWWDGSTEGKTVFITGYERETKVLGPDGKPYVLVQPKQTLGFDLSKKEKEIDL